MSSKALGLVGCILLLLAGCVYFYLTVPASPSTTTVGRALHPWPDGAEYLDAAVSLAHHGKYKIHVAGEEHPPRYPFGHSSMIAVALWLGTAPEEAAYRTNQVAGGLLLAFLALIFWNRRHRLEASLSVVLLATLPAFVILCRSPLSEITSTLLAVVAIWLLYIYSQGAPFSRALVGAILLGLGLCFRTSSVFLFIFVPAAILAREELRLKPAVRDLMLLGSCFGLGLLPGFIYNIVSFGHPLHTGYEYWVPYWNATEAFSFEFVKPNLIYYWQELIQHETDFTAATNYGHGQGSYLTTAFVLLACLALLVFRKHRRVWCFALAGAAYQALMTFYFYLDARLSFPLMVLMVPLIAGGVAKVWQRRNPIETALTVLLLGATLLGWPNAQGGADSIALLTEVPKENLSEHNILQLFKTLDLPGSELVLTDMALPYVHALLPTETIVAPLNYEHYYNHNPEVFRYGAKERTALVSRALRSGRTVWAVTSERDIFTLASVYTPPTGYGWEIVAQKTSTSGIARLVDLD